MFAAPRFICAIDETTRTMLLVQIGSITINVDHVVAFVEEDEATMIVFAVPQKNATADAKGLYTLRVDGDASRQLRHWISRNAERGTSHPAGFAMLPDDE